MRKDYLAFFASLFFSRLADQILLFIVPLVVFQVTNSASWAGLAFFAESLPRFLAFPICGALCDKFSPIKMLHISQVYRALICVLGVFCYLWLGGVFWLVALSAICGVLTTQGIMAREVVMPYVFQHYTYTKTLSYSQIADQTGLVLGPLAAALLLQVWPWYGVVLVAAALFFIADFFMLMWKKSSNVTLKVFSQHQDVWIRPVKIALRHILNIKDLQRIIVLAVGVNLIVGVTLATSAPMVLGHFNTGKNDYAVLQAAGAIVTIIILFVLARVSLPQRVLGGLGYSMLVCGALLSSICPNLIVYALGFLLIVGFDKMFNIYMRTIRQRVIPQEDFGKTVGVVTLLNNLSQPLAGLLVALLAAPLGTRTVIFILTAVAACLGLSVRFLNRDDLN